MHKRRCICKQSEENADFNCLHHKFFIRGFDQKVVAEMVYTKMTLTLNAIIVYSFPLYLKLTHRWRNLFYEIYEEILKFEKVSNNDLQGIYAVIIKYKTDKSNFCKFISYCTFRYPET